MAGNRMRITDQLIDTASAAHIWADHFDGVLDNIFDLQDQVAGSVVGAIERSGGRSKNKPTIWTPTIFFCARQEIFTNTLRKASA